MTASPDIKPIETRYAGCRFRSRLEARWAVFFDHLGIGWEYEPQGFVIEGRPYLPDFLLTDCGTWIEVKGQEDDLDHGLMRAAAKCLPEMAYRCERGPKLMILGPLPRVAEPSVPLVEGGYRRYAEGDWGWIGMDHWSHPDHGEGIIDAWYGFGSYCKNLRPWSLCNTSGATPVETGTGSWLDPVIDPYESGVPEAYIAAKSARFEHGEVG